MPPDHTPKTDQTLAAGGDEATGTEQLPDGDNETKEKANIVPCPACTNPIDAGTAARTRRCPRCETAFSRLLEIATDDTTTSQNPDSSQ